MRVRSILLVVALLVFAAGACTPAPDSGGQTATMAPATTTTARASIAVKGQARFAPPGLLPVARRKPAPALRVTAFDGRTVSLAGLRGRPVVVSFFESWCGTCQAEQPDLTKVAGDFAGRVGFVGVSYRDTVAAGRAYQRRFKVPYPLANDASGRTWARWRVPYQPVVVLVDKHGRIAERFDGGTTGGTLAAALTYLLGE
jgi:thiol-disulfide isomerase/thioredoxin